MAMKGRVAQLTDTHIVREGSTYLGTETARYLADALAAVHTLDPLPDYIAVTGDLVNSGRDAQYARFREIMSASRIPYFVIPGNHDDRVRMRAMLARETYGGVAGELRHFSIDDFPIRLIGLDCNAPRPSPRAVADAATLVAVHQPPFRTGLHYLDVLGFGGRSHLRTLVNRHTQAGAVISGHIHCVRRAVWKGAVASSAPSTAPQVIPLIFMQGRILGLAHEAPGFAVHDLLDDGTFARTVFRRRESGAYAADE